MRIVEIVPVVRIEMVECLSLSLFLNFHDSHGPRSSNEFKRSDSITEPVKKIRFSRAKRPELTQKEMDEEEKCAERQNEEDLRRELGRLEKTY